MKITVPDDQSQTTLDKLLACLPDTRGWVAIGLFGLTAYVLHLMGSNDKLATSQLFTSIATAIVVSGLIGGVVAFLYGSSQSSQGKDATIAAALKSQSDAETGQ